MSIHLSVKHSYGGKLLSIKHINPHFIIKLTISHFQFIQNTLHPVVGTIMKSLAKIHRHSESRGRFRSRRLVHYINYRFLISWAGNWFYRTLSSLPVFCLPCMRTGRLKSTGLVSGCNYCASQRGTHAMHCLKRNQLCMQSSLQVAQCFFVDFSAIVMQLIVEL